MTKFEPIPLDKTITEMGWSLVGQHGNHSRGEKHYAARLTEQDVRDIRNGKYKPLTRAAEALGVHYGTITKVYRGESWAHVR